MTNLVVARTRSAFLSVLVGLVAATVLVAAPAHAADGKRAPAGQSGSKAPTSKAVKAVQADRITKDFFGMGVAINSKLTTWPSFNPSSVRIAFRWSAIERTRGVYDWTGMDVQVAAAEANGARPLIVIEGTPLFHVIPGGAKSIATPPRPAALNAYVRALAGRYGARADYQVWNEGNVPTFFNGIPQHLADMTRVVGRAVRSVSPKSKVVAPSFLLRGSVVARNWYRTYWSSRVGRYPVSKFVDVAAVSAYPMPNEGPEESIALTQFARRVLDKSGFSGPIWATEINYGASGLDPTVAPIPVDRQVSYVIRTYVLQASIGTQRAYWWHWTPHPTINTVLQASGGALTPAGEAIPTTESWILGTRPVGCKVRKGVTTCSFKVGQKVTRHISWSRSGRVRTTLTPAGATTRTNVNGVSKAIKPFRKMRVGLVPVMVEARTEPGDRTRGARR